MFFVARDSSRVDTTDGTRTGRRVIAAIAGAVVVIAVAVLISAPTGAANEPAKALEAWGQSSMLGLHLGRPSSENQQRTPRLYERRRSTEPPPSDDSGAFIYRRGRFRPLSSVPDASLSLTNGVNNRGQTTGLYIDADATPRPDGTFPAGSIHGFVRDQRGRITSFDVPNGDYTRPLGINDRGQTAGDYSDPGATLGPDGRGPPGTIHGFVRDRRGVITTFDAPFFRLHDVRDLNDRGQIVGYYDNPDDTQRGYLRQPDGRTTPIDYPGADVHAGPRHQQPRSDRRRLPRGRRNA